MSQLNGEETKTCPALFKWYVTFKNGANRKGRPHVTKVVFAENMEAAKKIAKNQMKKRRVYEYAGTHRADLWKFFQGDGEKFKTCPQCGKEMLERRSVCKYCGHFFIMLCQGCGRDTLGRIWCPECADKGEYHFQRTESLPLIRPEEKNVEIFVQKMLTGRKDQEIAC